jgi:hypothetical protein
MIPNREQILALEGGRFVVEALNAIDDSVKRRALIVATAATQELVTLTATAPVGLRRWRIRTTLLGLLRLWPTTDAGVDNGTGVQVTRDGYLQPSGVTFPSTQLPSSDANTLDDYEEGTWVATDGSGAGLALTVYETATYLKIGRMVFVTVAVTYPATASGLAAKLGGLPFTADVYGTIPVCYCTAVAALTGLCRTTSTGIELVQLAGGAVQTNALMTGKTIILTGTYRTAS